LSALARLEEGAAVGAVAGVVRVAGAEVAGVVGVVGAFMMLGFFVIGGVQASRA
jgi:hypothetical protein